MKIRQGFVSNSSSSSFMICVAKIEDEELFNKWVKKNKIEIDAADKYSCFNPKVITLDDILSDNVCGEIKFSAEKNEIIVESFQTDIVFSVDPEDLEAKYFIVNIANDEGDGSFLSEYDDLDHNIDLDFFPEDQQLLYDELSKSNGFGDSNQTFGAGRNG